MKAAVLEALGKITVKDVPDAEPGPGEVKLRVRACATRASILPQSSVTRWRAT